MKERDISVVCVTNANPSGENRLGCLSEVVRFAGLKFVITFDILFCLTYPGVPGNSRGNLMKSCFAVGSLGLDSAARLRLACLLA